MKPEELIIAILERYPALDDDALAKLSGVESRQKVSRICRDLESQGRLIRERRKQDKIMNRLVQGCSTSLKR